MPSIRVIPSILAADKGRLAAECRRAERAGADGLHIDAMDGHFVANLSFGPAFVAMAREAVSLPLGVHLMVTRPDRLAPAFLAAGASTVMIHVEADCDPRPVLAQIREQGARAGIVLKPDTPVPPVLEFDGCFDEVLCMSVHPGFGGQAFLPAVLPKVAALRAALPDIDLAVDGGINATTAVACARAGANIFIAGTHFFGSDDMAGAIRDLRIRCQQASADP